MLFIQSTIQPNKSMPMQIHDITIATEWYLLSNEREAMFSEWINIILMEKCWKVFHHMVPFLLRLFNMNKVWNIFRTSDMFLHSNWLDFFYNIEWTEWENMETHFEIKEKGLMLCFYSIRISNIHFYNWIDNIFVFTFHPNQISIKFHTAHVCSR